jgi:hypothetical protein
VFYRGRARKFGLAPVTAPLLFEQNGLHIGSRKGAIGTALQRAALIFAYSTLPMNMLVYAEDAPRCTEGRTC